MNEPYPGPPDNVGVPSASDPYATNHQPAPGPSNEPAPGLSGPPTPQTHTPQPYSPGQATPTYGAPSYSQPPYGTPQYGQPPYSQPDQTQYQPPAYGSAPYPYAPPVKAGGSTTKILLIVLAVVIVVVAGVIAGLVAVRSPKQAASAASTASAAATPRPSASSAGPTTPSATPGGSSTIFKLPKTAAGLSLAPSAGLGSLMSKSLPHELGGVSTTGLYTSTDDATKLLILIGIQTDVGDPQLAVAGAFAGLASDSDVKSVKRYPAGSMGGAMECGSGHLSESADIPAGVCVVADSHGLIITIFTARSASSAAKATRTLRPSFEHI